MASEYEAINNDIREKEQCILFSYLENIIKQSGQNRKVYKNYVQLSGDNPHEVISRLTGNPGMSFLLNMPNAVMSLLVPQIRIFGFKNTGSVSNPNESVFEFTFDDRVLPASVESVTAGGSTRINGIGIKSFSWDFLGTDYAQVKNNLQAKLEIHMNSIHELDRRITAQGQSNVTWRYFDLITHSIKGDIQNPVNNKHNKIYAVVGWAVPPGLTDFLLEETARRNGFNATIFGERSLRSVIENSKIGLYLFTKDHQLTFEQNGVVKMTIEYNAAVEGILSNPKADLFMLDRGKKQSLTNLEGNLSQSVKREAKCKSKKKRTEEEEAKLEEHKNIILAQKRKLQASVVDKLVQKDLVRYAKIERQELVEKIAKASKASNNQQQEILKKFDNQSIKDLYKLIGIDKSVPTDNEVRKSVEEATKRFKGKTADQVSEETLTIYKTDSQQFFALSDSSRQFILPFVFLGDILDIVLDILYDSKLKLASGSEIRPLIGPMVYYVTDGKGNYSRRNINLADVPISFNSFMVFLVDKIIRPDRSYYPLKMFIRDLITNLIQPVLSNPMCTGLRFTQRNRVKFSVISSPELNKDPVTGRGSPANKYGSRYGKARVNINGVSISQGSLDLSKALLRGERPFSYLYIYSVSGDTEILIRDKEHGESRDNKRGIFTYRMGSNGGLIKTISFSKTDQPHLRTSRIHRASEHDNQFPDIFNYLTQKYDAQIDLVGCPFVMPGQFIYIEPSSLGTKPRSEVLATAKQIGLGGYYMINKVTCSISDSKFVTKIDKAIWQSDGENTPNKNIHALAPKDKCK